jgi:hypothetical protein
MPCELEGWRGRIHARAYAHFSMGSTRTATRCTLYRRLVKWDEVTLYSATVETGWMLRRRGRGGCSRGMPGTSTVFWRSHGKEVGLR